MGHYLARRDFLKLAASVGAGAVTMTTLAPRAAAEIFDAADFGVIADGNPHNNVANLIDCCARAAAVGADVVLPAGVIDTSDAIADTTLIADSGRTYKNNGGIPLPVATPMTISGRGQGVTVLRLSAGFPRAFDFWSAKSGQRYESITIRQLTIDRNHLIGVDIASPGAVGGSVTLTRATWTTLPGISAIAFKNARVVWFPVTNGGTARSISMASRVNDGSLQVRNDSDSTDFTLNAGDLVQGALRDHVIVGTLQFGGTVPTGWDMSINGLTIENVDSVNVSTETADGLSAKKSDSSPNIFIDVQKADGPAVPSITNCVVRNVRMFGGESGVYIGGQNGCFIDECWVFDSFHDTMVDPPSNYVSANFMLGAKAWVGRVGLIRCHGRRSGDVGCEIDQPWEAYESDCVWEDSFHAVYSTTFVTPARSAAGPPTARLRNDIAEMSNEGDVLVVDVDGRPAGLDGSGVLQIDSELFWYAMQDESGTTLHLTRGLNGTLPGPHPSGAAVTFVETHRTRLHSVRSTIRNRAVMSVPGGGRGFVQYENSGLPLPPVNIRDAAIELTGGSLELGEAIHWIGWQPDLEVNGLRFTHRDAVATESAVGSAISWWWEFGASHASRLSSPAPRIHGDNNQVRVTGIRTSPDSSYSAVQSADGIELIELTVIADVVLMGPGPGPGPGT